MKCLARIMIGHANKLVLVTTPQSTVVLFWNFYIVIADAFFCQKFHIRVTNDAAEWGVISRCFTAFIFSLLRDLLMADQRYGFNRKPRLAHPTHEPRHFVHFLVTSSLGHFSITPVKLVSCVQQR